MNRNRSPRKKSIVPILLSILIGCFILFLAWSGRQASTSGTDITDRDYYSKGLRYNSTLLEKRAASVIGWHLETQIDGRTLIFDLRDRNGAPIPSANGHLVFSEPLKNIPISLPLVEETPGRYRIDLPDNLTGESLVRIDFERDGARINRQLLINAPEPALPKKNE